MHFWTISFNTLYNILVLYTSLHVMQCSMCCQATADALSIGSTTTVNSPHLQSLLHHVSFPRISWNTNPPIHNQLLLGKEVSWGGGFTSANEVFVEAWCPHNKRKEKRMTSQGLASMFSANMPSGKCLKNNQAWFPILHSLRWECVHTEGRVEWMCVCLEEACVYVCVCVNGMRMH